MNDNELKELSKYADKNLNVIREIHRLSEKIDSNQEKLKQDAKRKETKDTIFFVISATIGLLTLAATILFGVLTLLR